MNDEDEIEDVPVAPATTHGHKARRGAKKGKARAPLVARIKRLQLIAMDVDGVLTDGTILLSPNGEGSRLLLARRHRAQVLPRGSTRRS